MNETELALSQKLRTHMVNCPMHGLHLDLEQDGDFDFVLHYRLKIYQEEFHSPRYSDIDRVAFAQWMNTKLMPELNSIAQVTLQKEARRGP